MAALKILPRGGRPTDWPIKHFSPDEFRCKHSGRIPDTADASCGRVVHFLRFMDAIREGWGKPLVVTSGYRDPSHPVERSKVARPTGAHPEGVAMDVAVWGDDVEGFVELATLSRLDDTDADSGIGIGINRRGKFVHVDLSVRRPVGKIVRWSYL